MDLIPHFHPSTPGCSGLQFPLASVYPLAISFIPGHSPFTCASFCEPLPQGQIPSFCPTQAPYPDSMKRISPNTPQNQAAFLSGDKHIESLPRTCFSNPSPSHFQYGNTIPEIVLEGFPADVDLSRFALVYDGQHYRVFYFRRDSTSMLYHGIHNPMSGKFEFGLSSAGEITIRGWPLGTDFSSLAVLFDGANFNLYLRQSNDPGKVVRFVCNPDSHAFEYESKGFPAWPIVDVPADAKVMSSRQLIFRFDTDSMGMAV